MSNEWRGELATKLAAAASGNARKTNLRHVLEEDLCLRSSLFYDCDAPPEQKHPERETSWSCIKLGVCVCKDGPNPHLTQLRSRWLAALKLTFPFSGKARKEQLKESKVVVDFNGSKVVDGVETF
eukprot:4774029-Pyramimonas_sp.AAC.1